MGSVKQVLVAALATLVLLTVSATSSGATTVAAAAKPLTMGPATSEGAAATVDTSLPIEASHEEEGADETAADIDVTSRRDRYPRRPGHPYGRRCKIIKICKIRIVFRHRPCRGRRYSYRLAVPGADDDEAEDGDAEEGTDGEAASAEGEMDTTTRDRRPYGRRLYKCRRVRCFKKIKCRRRRRYPRH